MSALSFSATNLPPGSFTARWAAWVIGIRSVGDAWHVRVWSWAHGARVQISKRAVLATSNEAVTWACEVLRNHGAQVFVDGREQRLEAFLVFSSAPDEVPCSS